MPRSMPKFDDVLISESVRATDLVVAGELARAQIPIKKYWRVTKLEDLYELAFLRVFVRWEICLEEVFLRSLCGYSSSAGVEVLTTGATHFRSINLAKTAVYGSNNYLLWHNPRTVINRIRGFIMPRSATNPGQQEYVISSYISRLEHFAAIRHRIAHGQEDAKNKFDRASLAIAGRTYLGSKPGRLLRDPLPGVTPKQTYFETICSELCGLMSQMV
tara:strand:- start:407 stop:1057 length:651 start_codon:yes stop_codon:yes gene_type:complete